jgi:hypothetical protein
MVRHVVRATRLVRCQLLATFTNICAVHATLAERLCNGLNIAVRANLFKAMNSEVHVFISLDF